MQSLKSIFGVFRAVVPIAYCGSLLYYFLGFGGSIEDLKEIGLLPTVLGLGIVGLLFCIPLILRIVRLVAGMRPPGSGPGAPLPDEAFDAEAVVARYKARQSNDPVLSGSAPPPVRPRPLTGPRQSFGRRTH